MTENAPHTDTIKTSTVDPKTLETGAHLTSGIINEVDTAQAHRINEQAKAYVARLFNALPHSPEYENIMEEMGEIGIEVTKMLAVSSNQILKRNMKTDESNQSAYHHVGNAVKRLETISSQFSPKRNTFSNNIFGFGKERKIENYFRSYKNSEQEVNEVIKSLLRSRDQIIRDNTFLTDEQNELREKLTILEEARLYISKIREHVNNYFNTTPDTYHSEEEVIFAINQKEQDITTQFLVSTQAFIGIKTIKSNNLSLLKNIHSTRTTTITALQTVITIGQVIANQGATTSSLEELTQNANQEVTDFVKTVNKNAHSSDPKDMSEAVINQVKHQFETLNNQIDALKTKIDNNTAPEGA